MMCDQYLPTSLWVEASSTVVCILDRIPYAILGENTTKGFFSSEKKNVGRLNIFHCPDYIHVPKEKRIKMEPSRKNLLNLNCRIYSTLSMPKFSLIRIYARMQQNTKIAIETNMQWK